MLDQKLKKISLVYVLLQAAIWAKCAAFFSIFGYGRSMPFNLFAFPPDAVLFDRIFHEGIHVAIGILALLFGKNLKRPEKLKLAGIVLAAVALHNAGYWLTMSHESALYSAVDFGRDTAILLAFIALGNLFERFGVWKKIFSILPKQKV